MGLFKRKEMWRFSKFRTGAPSLQQTVSGVWFMSVMMMMMIVVIVGVSADTDDDVETLTFLPQSTPLIMSPRPPDEQVSELAGGVIENRQQRLNKIHSPYLVREDIIIEKTGELAIDAGVELRFSPMVGLTVRGILSANGLPDDRIVLTSALEPRDTLTLPELRLVDGPSILAGRLQIFHNNQWRSVCTNSRNWTRADLETACRQLGFQGGAWWGWVDRQPGFQPRLLFEEPKCKGTETSLFECNWHSRQMGAGACDYHPDLGIQCLPYHVTSSNIVQHWRGVRFEGASSEHSLTHENTLYVLQSLSELSYVDIRFAGSGRDYNATSAVHVEGVPPKMTGVSVLYSAYNGINITMPDAGVTLDQCELKWNRGYGIYLNSSSDLTYINGCLIQENGADGIRFVHHDELADVNFDRTKTVDFCTFPITSSQTYPISITVEQNKYAPTGRECSKYFYTQPGHVLTLHFAWMWTDRNDSAVIEVYDGASQTERQLASVSVRNGTRPQSVVTTRNTVYIRFKAEARTQMIASMKLTSGYRKSYDMNVTASTVADNNGRGIAIENMHSQLHVHQSSVSNNNHVAGIHVSQGVGDVNVTESRISFNVGDGINISYTGGNRNITRSSISSNKGYGIAVWMNHSVYTEHIAFNQTTVVSYSEIFKNGDVGIFVGNFSGDSYVNITGNSFNNSLESAIEIMSAWRPGSGLLRLQIGHNDFRQNKRLGVKLKPALNIEGRLEYNYFSQHTYGCILVKNQPIEEFDILPARLVIENNQFEFNQGIYVVNLGLSPYSEVQSLLFTRNFVRDNHIREPFEVNEARSAKLMPRSRVAAPVVVSSSNVEIFRNILQNLESAYEVGSHLEDQSLVINCTYNWLGSAKEDQIFSRLFHRKDRYNLAKLEYLPFLLHSSNPSSTLIMTNPTFVPQFNPTGRNVVGGEVDGIENLRPGEYTVERDINVRPGGRLTLQPGVTLRFPPGVGVMVAGKMEARGRGPNDIRLTLKEEIVETPENDTGVAYLAESLMPVRLLGGRTNEEGRLQVRIGGIWGTVCNYGWTMIDAALVCHQLGLVLNPDDWFLERSEIPQAGTSEKIILSNVRCTEDDIDITTCPAERENEFEHSCTHEHDVGLRCHESSWAGVRLGVLAERADLQFITVERAGLLDYSTNIFKPALQVDFSRHALENVRIVNNLQDGLGILYSDLYSSGVANTVKNSEFSGNRGNGISFKQLGLKISGSSLENNKKAGIYHNPTLTAYQQRELAGWFKFPDDLNIQYSSYKPILIPQYYTDIHLEVGETKYFLTQRVGYDEIDRNFNIYCEPGYVIGIQLLNPIHNRSTEDIVIYDARSVNISVNAWNLRRDLLVFPTISSSYAVVMQYRSGSSALGGAVLAVSTVAAPIQDIKNRIVGGPVPTLTVTNSRIKSNKQGVRASFYNRYLNEIGDHFLRKSNESIQLFGCDISYNEEEAVFVHSPFWDVHHSNISEITVMINNSLITDNGKGIFQFSRDLRSSNNLFHWILQDNSIERNNGGGFDVSLPYVWQYNENFTHSLYIENNTWRNNKQFAFAIDGHFAQLNLTHNMFEDNQCKSGLISIKGMEKRMRIAYNRIRKNNGVYMVEFRADSQSEILGEVDARFFENEVKENHFRIGGTRGFHQVYNTPSYVIGFHGIQKVNVNRNLFGNNGLDYELVAGIRTAKINTAINVVENWWGSGNVSDIKKRIFDFDDWNNHAIARFRPYLTEDSFDSSMSVSWAEPVIIDLDNLGGRLTESLVLYARSSPYIIRADITVMPGVTLTIRPGVVMEFAPNVGLLVLGVLKAQGVRGQEIIMRPVTSLADLEGNKVIHRRRRQVLPFENYSESIRLCTGRNCTTDLESNDSETASAVNNKGFLEYYNSTTMQWVPLCDDRFTERNAQVVCRELGFDSLSVYLDHGTRVEYHPNSLSRIWSWPEPLQCTGDESRLEDCPIRLNGQVYGHRHRCEWDSKFIFIHCGERNLPAGQDYWGGIRFADGEFEQNLYEHRSHDVVTHQTTHRAESVVEYVKVTGAGILHNEKSPAVQSISRSPAISNMNITLCASDGINLISPLDNTRLLFNSIESTLGVGISAVSLTGEGRESSESSFTPLRVIHIPYHIFSMIDICDTTKLITMEERVLIYYKYDNNPVNCVKIFNSVYHTKPFGFRLLQFNLFNSTNKPGEPDSITLYDGDIYNVTSTIIAKIEVGSHNERRLFRTKGPSLSVKLFATGASSYHGFIAEIVTLPISAIGFNRDVQHNISFSVLTDNQQGAISYASAGEVNPTVTMEWNQFNRNCKILYGNFTTCQAAIDMDIQNTQTVFFRNNLVRLNQGGLSIHADSGGSATSLKGWIHNNLFTNNRNNPALYVEGRQSSPYQEVIIYGNYFTKNFAPYKNIIILKQVVSNFSYNYVQDNWGYHILEVSGFEKVRLPIYQTTSHNGFYKNYALHWESRGTIVAGTAGQKFVDNVFFNPDNDYEIVTVNRSLSHDVWKTPIDAKHNWWGYNETLAVMGRIRDHSDDLDLLEVDFRPFQMNNRSVLSGKCPPGWNQVGDTCYIYIGAPMAFEEARSFCRSVNASMPYVMTNYLALYLFLRSQQQNFQYYDRVWVQHIDMINRCTVFTYQKIEVDNCPRLNPFLCEIDPKVSIDPLGWRDDVLTVAVLGTVGGTILLVALAGVFWYFKSRHRHLERLERRNSIRQSLHSIRSVGLEPSRGGFTEIGIRRKPTSSQRSSPTLTKGSDYKKMMNGSFDSMDKSQFNSSVEDNHSYDIYEAHNPNAAARNFNDFTSAIPTKTTTEVLNPSFDLAYRNEGFKDTSTFSSSHENWQPSTNMSEYNYDDQTAGTDYIHNSSTLPLDTSLAMADFTFNVKQGSDYSSQVPYQHQDSSYSEPPEPPLPFDDSFQHDGEYPLLQPQPSAQYSFDYDPGRTSLLETDIDSESVERPKSEILLETNLDDEHPVPVRSKSEVLLETNIDDYGSSHVPSAFHRSKSQPLETSM